MYPEAYAKIPQFINIYSKIIGLLKNPPFNVDTKDLKELKNLSPYEGFKAVILNMNSIFERLMIPLTISNEDTKKWQNCKSTVEMLISIDDDDIEVHLSVFEQVYDLVKEQVKNVQATEQSQQTTSASSSSTQDYYDRYKQLYLAYLHIYKQYQHWIGSNSSSNSNNELPETSDEMIDLLKNMIFNQINLAPEQRIYSETCQELDQIKKQIRLTNSRDDMIILFQKYAQTLCAAFGFQELSSQVVKRRQATMPAWGNTINPTLTTYQELYQQYVILEEKYYAILKAKDLITESNIHFKLDKKSPNDTKLILATLLNFMKTEVKLTNVFDTLGNTVTGKQKVSLNDIYAEILAFQDLRDSPAIHNKLNEFLLEVNAILEPLAAGLSSEPKNRLIKN
ncbi:MAG: hypothetical protein ABSF18_00700 [Gammaproteobacteria bacterium]